ncbi:MAG TPA: GDP-L-fucose synthase [Stellaceae bacterium]|nr:GDP-L-fucose synthase [Stellaceae bacterium]
MKNSNSLPFTLRNKRVWVAGHRGLVGSALVRRLQTEECEIVAASRDVCDLRDGAQVDRFVRELRPHAVFLAAARVGGIYANDQHPADFIYDNLMIQSNVIGAAQRHGVEKLMFLGSSCIYPKFAPQPIPEDALLTGPLEPTNQWYATAKIAGIKLCQALRRQHGCDFISVMPTNLYGQGDNFDPLNSHVVPGLIVKLHDAKIRRKRAATIWGTGRPRREFLYVEDAADGMVYLMKHYSGEGIVNLGSGQEISIAELAELIGDVVGFDGAIAYDASKPDGTPRKLLDVSRMATMGWRPRTSLREGLEETYQWYVEHYLPMREPNLQHA